MSPQVWRHCVSLVLVIFCTVTLQCAAETGSSALSGRALSAALQSSELILFTSDIHQHQRRDKHEHAVVTHICGDDWIPGALALGATLRNLSKSADLVVMIDKNVTLPYRELLSSLFDRVYVQEPILPHPSIKRNGADCVTLQMRSWQLPYKKALYMDSDMVALRSPDPLFSTHGEITAKIDRWGFGWNGGMFMCEPSNATFSILQKALYSYKGGEKKGIQQYFNHMFPKCNRSESTPPRKRGLAGCWGSVLRREHNKFTRELTPSEVQLLTANSSNGPYDSIHYSGDWQFSDSKPWQTGCMATRDSTTRLQGLARTALMTLWIRAFREFKPPPGMEKQAQIECPLFTCAEKRPSLDYVVVAPDVDCTTLSVVKSLVKFAGPRKILVIAPGEACKKVASQLGDSAQCIDQDELQLQFTRESVHGFLAQRFALNMTAAWLRSYTDMYFQQFVKMGIAEVASKYALSEDFVIWDSDTVMLRDFCPMNPDGQANLMEGKSPGMDTCDKSVQRAFFLMTGLDNALSDRNKKTFASNHMVVNSRAMSSLLTAFHKQRPKVSHWSAAVLEATCPSAEACSCGFSEFGSYASWMKQKFPEKVAEVPAQQTSVQESFERHYPYADQKVLVLPVCCPDKYKDFGKHLMDGNLAVTFKRDAVCTGAKTHMKVAQRKCLRLVPFHPSLSARPL